MVALNVNVHLNGSFFGSDWWSVSVMSAISGGCINIVTIHLPQQTSRVSSWKLQKSREFQSSRKDWQVSKKETQFTWWSSEVVLWFVSGCIARLLLDKNNGLCPDWRACLGRLRCATLDINNLVQLTHKWLEQVRPSPAKLPSPPAIPDNKNSRNSHA